MDNGTIFIDEPQESNFHSRNVCIFADGEVDRSPTGTGVSGRLAIHYARDEIAQNKSITVEINRTRNETKTSILISLRFSIPPILKIKIKYIVEKRGKKG